VYESHLVLEALSLLLDKLTERESTSTTTDPSEMSGDAWK